MKKVVSTVLVALMIGITSCKKDNEVKPLAESCNCGIIIDDDINKKEDISVYSIDVQSECTDKVQTVFLNKVDWVEAKIGDNYCVEKPF